jgi:cell division protein FtsA
MSRRIATGIDIGTYQVKLVVVEEVLEKGNRSLHILGTGLAESKGLRHGYIVNKEEVTASIKEAKRQAEAVSRVPIKSAFLAIGGVSLDEVRATGSAIISRADQEITPLDLEKAGKTAREAAAPSFLNRNVLHEIPLEHRIDGNKVLGDPLGMKGVRLEIIIFLSPVLLSTTTPWPKLSKLLISKSLTRWLPPSLARMSSLKATRR